LREVVAFITLESASPLVDQPIEPARARLVDAHIAAIDRETQVRLWPTRIQIGGVMAGMSTPLARQSIDIAVTTD
jgi:hypothetical protein